MTGLRANVFAFAVVIALLAVYVLVDWWLVMDEGDRTKAWAWLVERFMPRVGP